jgi:hypothetical protein
MSLRSIKPFFVHPKEGMNQDIGKCRNNKIWGSNIGKVTGNFQSDGKRQSRIAGGY